ncbi:major facilitator superfamily domain-containing protein [Neohortaea acidophila]|uniref:Major facilitator superfamily domain-containing protein n=1 Tax=Neohortaea acidophila TaxID=245834 RepID=A0A6A6Q6T7_9PEZI|nr:major facilitator superfamily domain-containing protein [Neohortaea acidophila]KAF2487704.1 major facilitator superfamily domain-containing protein [Neohortaea acidophila]
MAELPVPGTVQQVDDSHFTSGIRRDARRTDIILIPQPSDHPDDPLNWSKWRKRVSDLGHNVYTFGVVIMVSSYTPANLKIQAATGIPVADINTGVGIYFLFIGYSNLIWQPLAINYGRRPVLLASILLVIVQALWQAYCTTTGEWYANRALMGISAGPVETLLELVVADLHFSHERGAWLSVYVWILFSGSFLSCIPAGFVADALGWQWIEYIVCIIGAAFFVWLFFTFEETAFYRPDVVSAETIGVGNGKVDTDDVETPRAEAKYTDEKRLGETPMGHNSDAGTTALDRASDIVGTPKPYWRRLSILSGYDRRRKSNVWRNAYISIAILRFPAILYSGLLVAMSLSWYNVVNGTLPTILGKEPYNFSANIIGVFYVAGIIGVTFGSYFGGALSDRVAIYMARRNGGVFEPEHRLWIFLIALIVHPLGCLLFGVGAAHHIHWVGLAFGLGFFCVTLPMGSSVAYNYILDSYKEVAGEGLVSVVLIRNTIGFGFAYAILPMIDALGVQDAFILLTFLGLFVWCLTFVMLIFGKRFRKWTARAYWELVEEQGLRVH